MANVTLLFGILLIVLGPIGYFGSGGISPTAFIPSAFGVLLVACGMLARNERFRKHAMHAAVAVGLLGLVGTWRGLVKVPMLLSGQAEQPWAIASKSIMAVLCLLFVALCIRSFVAARRRRTEG